MPYVAMPYLATISPRCTSRCSTKLRAAARSGEAGRQGGRAELRAAARSGREAGRQRRAQGGCERGGGRQSELGAAAQLWEERDWLAPGVQATSWGIKARQPQHAAQLQEHDSAWHAAADSAVAAVPTCMACVKDSPSCRSDWGTRSCRMTAMESLSHSHWISPPAPLLAAAPAAARAAPGAAAASRAAAPHSTAPRRKLLCRSPVRATCSLATCACSCCNRPCGSSGCACCSWVVHAAGAECRTGRRGAAGEAWRHPLAPRLLGSPAAGPLPSDAANVCCASTSML